MKHEGRITLSRSSRDVINIRIKDESSRQQITEVSLSLENFALMMTGLAEVECQHETTKDVSNIGKTKVIEDRSIVAPHLGYDRDLYVQWLEENAQEEGYILDTYLKSQRSIVFKESVTLHYSVYKYVENQYTL